MRQIRLGFPSKKYKLVLFENTEDEVVSTIYKIDSDQPYAKVNNTKYYLTKDEIEHLRKMQHLFG